MGSCEKFTRENGTRQLILTNGSNNGGGVRLRERNFRRPGKGKALKQIRRITLITWLLLSVAVLSFGGLAVFFSARSAPSQMNQAHSSPFSLYDTRACVRHPSTSTCDGRLPVADWDSGTFSNRNGEEACLSSSLQNIKQVDILAGKQLIGQMSLMWSPVCQSHYVQVAVDRPARATGVRITQIDPTAPAGVPGVPPHRSYSSFIDYGGGYSEINRAVSPLLFQPPGAGRLTATTIVILPGMTAAQASLEGSSR